MFRLEDTNSQALAASWENMHLKRSFIVKFIIIEVLIMALLFYFFRYTQVKSVHLNIGQRL